MTMFQTEGGLIIVDDNKNEFEFQVADFVPYEAPPVRMGKGKKMKRAVRPRGPGVEE